MKNYVQPVVLDNEEMFEGVYTASGAGGDCYTATAYIHQTPELGRNSFCVQANAEHAAANGHHSGAQILTLTFDKAVTYQSCSSANATPVVSSGTIIKISYNYHANATENHGLGDIYVTTNDGSETLGNPHAVLSCDYGVNDPNTDHKW